MRRAYGTPSDQRWQSRFESAAHRIAELEVELDAHEMIASDRDGIRCSCGGRAETWLEHVADLIWAAFPPTDTDLWRQQHARRERENRYPRSRRARRADEVTLADVVRARRVLERRQRENERLGRMADALGFETFADRADWLIAQDPWWHRRHGWPEHPFPDGYPTPTPKELSA